MKLKSKNYTKKMLSAQKRIPESLTTSTIPLLDTSDPDTSAIIEKVKKNISGKEKFEALGKFVSITNLFEPEEVHRNAVELAEEFPLSHLFSQYQINDKGKTVAFSGGINTNKITGDESAIDADMQRYFQLNTLVAVLLYISPALEIFSEEHEINDIFVADIVKNSPFVPPGREMFFFRGIRAGFECDFVSASLFLIPQLENSLRWVMEQNNIITSKLTQMGIQREKDLNDLLEDEFINRLLGDRYIFTLKALLTTQGGVNLRNKLAHGLAEYDELQGNMSMYFWWLNLRLLVLGKNSCRK